MKRVVLLVVVASAATASAQPSSKAKADATAAYQEGQRRYLDEDYLGAAKEFEIAYKLDPDPAYEFNIAQAYRLGKDCAKALLWYRKFEEDAPHAPNLDAVSKYIAEEEAQCAPRSPTVTDERTSGQPLPPPPPPSHLKRNLGIGALALGAIGVTSGIVFTWKVGSVEREREGLCGSTSPCVWTSQLSDREATLKRRGDRDSTLAIASYLVGGAALAAGAALLVLDHQAAAEHAVAIVPTSGGAFVSLTVRR